jgi:5-deoxy-5-amino-3-dehydroquinate dehydratase
MQTLLLVNGPNLSRLGARNPEIYGTTTLQSIADELGSIAQAHGWTFQSFQSNDEGRIIDFLESHRDCAALVINPGALMMNGWALRDALEDFPAPWIEVHISNVWARESFRHVSVLSPVASGVIAGLGSGCYAMAALELIQHRQQHAGRRIQP